MAFDASLWDSIPTLVSGAQLCLAPREELMPGEPLQATLEREAITVMALPPSVQVQLDPSRLPAMRTRAATDRRPRGDDVLPDLPAAVLGHPSLRG